jgi:hypothetical protein
VDGFWSRYGPIIKLSATLLAAAAKITTGINALFPPSLAEAFATVKETMDFLTDYAKQIGEIVDPLLVASGVERSTIDSVLPEAVDTEGLDLESNKLARVVGSSYIAFSQFLKTHNFDSTKLEPSMTKEQLDDGNWHWVIDSRQQL